MSDALARAAHKRQQYKSGEVGVRQACLLAEQMDVL